MSKLESLVPPLDLCKLIPAGEFEDSAFIWDKTTSIGFWDGEDKDGNHIGGFGKIPHKNYRLRQNYSERTRKHIKDQDIELDVFPAPTLEEIMVAMPYCQIYRRKNGSFVGCYDTRWDQKVSGETGSVAALKMWLKLKGIEA